MRSAPGEPPRLALGVIAGALALDVGSLNIINAALPSIGSQFELDSGTLQWVMTSYGVTFAGFLLLCGRLADVFGRRRTFALGIALFTAAALGGALAPDAGFLIAARAVQGIGAALSGPAAIALISEVFPEGAQRNRAFGVYAAVGAVSASGGLVIGGVLTQLLTWRSVFAMSAVFGALLLLGVRSALPPSVRRPQSLDLPGAITATLGLVLVVLGVSRAEQVGWTGPGVVASLVGAVVLLVGFVLWERRSKDSLIPPAIFRSRSVRAASLAAAVSYSTVVGLMFFAPLYTQDVLGYTPLQSALAIVPLSVMVFVVATYLSGYLLARFGQRPLLIGGLVVVALGIASWTWTTTDGVYWLQLLPGVVTIGVGMGIAFPAMTAAALTGVPQHQHGVAGAVNVVAQQIGATVGLVLLVAISAAGAEGPAGDDSTTLAGYHVAYLAAAALCVLGAVVITLGGSWNSHPRPEPDESSAVSDAELADDELR